MFRDMRRAGQRLSDEETLNVLKTAKRGVLSMIGDDGWPYGVYLNPFYNDADGRIYFHGSKVGHKTDSLRADNRVSFTVIDDGIQDDPGWALTFRSVVVFGRIEFVADRDFAIEICRRLAKRFNPDDADIEDEIRRAGAAVQEVTEDGPAAQAGLQRGDVITAVDGKAMTSSELVDYIQQASVGQQIKLSIYRQGDTLEITVPVGEQIQSALKEEEPQQSQQTYPDSFPWSRP